MESAVKTGSLLLVDLDPRTSALLHQSELSRASSLWTGAEAQAISVVSENARGVEAVLLGSRVAQPLHVAQRIHATDPDLGIVILTAPNRHAALLRAVSSTPLLGREVVCHPFTDDVSGLVQTLVGTALATRSRREHRDVTGDESDGHAKPARYLGTLLEAAPLGVLEADGAGRILGLNEKARALLECDERDAIGAPLERLFPPASDWARLLRDLPAEPRIIERTRRTGEPLTLEVTIGDAHGGDAGTRYLLLLQDVTKRVRAERSLRFLVEATLGLGESQDVSRTAARVASIAVPQLADWCALDLLEEVCGAGAGERADGRALRRVALTHANPAWAPAAAVLSRVPFVAAPGLRDPLATRRSERVSGVTRELLDALAADPLHREALAAQGARSILAVPIHVHGRALGIMTLVASREGRRFEDADVALAEDLASRAGFAIENARLFEELHRADRAKDEFLAMLAHELRNPLAPILTATRLLDGAAREGASQRAVDVIERQTRHMARIVDDLLDVSRIARGKVQIQQAPLDAGQLAREIAEDFRAAATQAGLALHVDAIEPCPVSGDRTRLSQVLGNLLSNAIKFSNRGGRIDVMASRQGDRAVIAVADTGIGLSPDLVRAIFEPFIQADRTLDRTRGGLGLGLAIVRGIVELHGGRVTASSDGPGLGARFSVELPLAEVAAPVPAPSPEPDVAAAPHRILVIDDNADLALTLGDLLEEMGHQVRTAPDGPRGIEVARELAPDIIFCDIGLPGMTGYEVAAALRREPELERTRIVALSGYGREQDRTRAFEAGFDEYVTKPMPIATLERIVGAS